MSSKVETTKAIEVFYSYSHKDQRLRDQLETQLALLKRQGLISEWHDRKISAGKEWADEIDQHLNTADLILLLISPDFMASDYCYNIEVKRAMERHERREARVIPIICRLVHWRGSAFGKLEPLPTNLRPITAPGWHNQDEAFFNVAEGIRTIVEELTMSSATSPSSVSSRPVIDTISSESIISAQASSTNTTQKSKRTKGIRILAVDDEAGMQRILHRNLTIAGYEVLIAEDGNQAIEIVRGYELDLILLDLGLGGKLDGFDVCMQVRQWTHIPIIIVSALSEERQKVKALDLGADDYLTKPFSSVELLARIRACLRRPNYSAVQVAESENQLQILQSDDGYLVMNIERRLVQVGTHEVKLTPTEFELLRQLMLYAGKVLTHRSLLRAVWGPEYGEEADYLRVYVRQLRRKVEIDPKHPQYILTEPGVGYVFSSQKFGEASEI